MKSTICCFVTQHGTLDSILLVCTLVLCKIGHSAVARAMIVVQMRMSFFFIIILTSQHTVLFVFTASSQAGSISVLLLALVLSLLFANDVHQY